MADQPKNPDLEAIAKQVEQSVKSGQADAVLAAGRDALQTALDALDKAERLDPRKLRKPINV